MNFTLTQSDIDAYLATCQPTDTVGFRFEPDSCLLANTLAMKYPEYSWTVDLDQTVGLLDLSDVNIANHILPTCVFFDLSPEMIVVRNQFDLLECPFERITKEQWEAASCKQLQPAR